MFYVREIHVLIRFVRTTLETSGYYVNVGEYNLSLILKNIKVENISKFT